MRLKRALLFLLLVSLAFPSGHCCRGRIRAIVLAVGPAATPSIVAVIVTYWETFHSYFKTEIKKTLWNALEWLAGKGAQKATEGNFLPVKLVLAPPQHKYITRTEELTQLKKLFDSFDTSTDDKVVYAVYLVGLPGSGKSELARQYGNLVYKNGDVYTVITLNTESEKQFRDDLIEAILELKAAKGTEPAREEFSKKTIKSLVYELRLLMRKRPGWLLIVDNIRQATQRSFYEELPEPGEDIWGHGYMLLTTQVLIRKEGEFVKIMETNEGMTPNDAKQLLCELVRRAKGDCPDRDAEAIVKRLEYLPLAILAAGTFIEEKMKLKLYILANYQDKFDEENAKAFDITMSDYPHSMRTALLLAVRNKVGGDSEANIFKDVFAFLGFVDKEEIMSHVVVSYLTTQGHGKGSIIKLNNFSLVGVSEEKKVLKSHQVTRDTFRAELMERSKRHSAKDLLLENFRNISQFLTSRQEGLYFLEYFHRVLTHHDYRLNDLISPEVSLEDAGDLVTFIYMTSPSPVNCSELEWFVARLSSAEENTAKSFVLRYFMCTLLRQCLQEDNQTDLSETYALKCAEIIEKLTKRPGLHTHTLTKGVLNIAVLFFQSESSPNEQNICKEDIDQTQLSFVRVVTWRLIQPGDLFLREEISIGDTCFERVLRRDDQSELCFHKAEAFKTLMGFRITSMGLRHPHELSIALQKTEALIIFYKYSKALSFLENVLDGLLIHGNWELCEWHNNDLIAMATEVLGIQHSLYIKVPDRLRDTARRLQHKLEQLFRETLICQCLSLTRSIDF